ncbi:MAG TPA: hypothetical protein VGL55_06615 [Steroidobacteraceae bacterium]|jgi:hypothetical protein
MTTADYLALLGQARQVLESYLLDGDEMRDDIAEVCQKIDDALPADMRAQAPRMARRIERAA